MPEGVDEDGHQRGPGDGDADQAECAVAEAVDHHRGAAEGDEERCAEGFGEESGPEGTGRAHVMPRVM